MINLNFVFEENLDSLFEISKIEATVHTSTNYIISSLDPIFARNSLFAEEDQPNAPAI